MKQWKKDIYINSKQERKLEWLRQYQIKWILSEKLLKEKKDIYICDKRSIKKT